MQGAGPALLDRIRTRIGWEGPVRTTVVESGHVRRFCEAIGDDNPRWLEEVPPTYLVALGTETPQVPEVLEYGKGWLNGGDRFDYRGPVRHGDRITSRTVLRDAFVKQGSTGSLLFLIFETDFTDQHGEVVARITGTRIRR